jgi:hypothetical protein
MAATAQRIADLERQLAELRGDFEATKWVLDAAFAAGRAFERGEYRGQQPPAQRARHLQAVPGGAYGRPAPEHDLEAEL